MIDFENGEAVKAEVLRLIKEGQRIYSSAGVDTSGSMWAYAWADGLEELRIDIRTNTFSLFLKLTFLFPRPVCPMKIDKYITIPVAGKPDPGAPMLEVLTKSIEQYVP